MSIEDSQAYRKELAQLLRGEPDHTERRQFWDTEKKIDEYKVARTDSLRQRLLELSGVLETDLLPLDTFQPKAPDITGSSFHDAEQPLTEEETKIVFYHQLYDDYENIRDLPRRQRRATEQSLQTQLASFITQPLALEQAIRIWHGRDALRQEKSTSPDLIAYVQNMFQKNTERNWQKVSTENIAEWIQVLSHEGVSSPFARNILRAYFQGPKNRSERIDGLYNLAEAALLLITDRCALAEAAKIGVFESDVLKKNTQYFDDFAVLLNMGGALNEEETLVKALNIDPVFLQLAYLCDLPVQEYLDNSQDYYQSSRWQSVSEQERQRLSIHMDRMTGLRRTLQLHQFRTQSTLMINLEELEQLRTKWPYNRVLFDNPFRERYERIAGEHILSKKMREEIQTVVKAENPAAEPHEFSITFAEGYRVDIIVPTAALLSKKKEIIDKILTEKPLTPELKAGLDRPQLVGVSVALNTVRIDGQDIYFYYRAKTQIEAQRHSVLELAQVGLPIPRGVQAETLPSTVETLARQIQDAQLRFLLLRGIQTPLQPTALRELGYEKFEFFRVEDDPQKIDIVIYWNNLPYKLRMDQFLNMDLKGAEQTDIFFQDLLRYTLLKIIEPILCKSRERVEKDTIAGSPDLLSSQPLIVRCGHLRYLPPGLHFTSTAAQHCFSREERDLAQIDAERIAAQKKAGIPVEELRHTTYVRPVIPEDGPNLEPLVANVSQVLQYD